MIWVKLQAKRLLFNNKIRMIAQVQDTTEIQAVNKWVRILRASKFLADLKNKETTIVQAQAITKKIPML
jgi:hypothetical protein